jgi:N-acylglucosamine-6-phosphate 2-epimerase
MLSKTEILDALRGRLIVSVQAYPGEPMRDPNTMAQIAASAVTGGAAAVRVQGLGDIQATRSAVEVPSSGCGRTARTGSSSPRRSSTPMPWLWPDPTSSPSTEPA